MENKLLASVCIDRGNFLRLADVLDIDDLSDAGQIVFKQIEEFYVQDPAAKLVDLEILKSRLVRLYPKQADMFGNVIDSLDVVSAPNVISEYVEVKLSALENKIGAALIGHKKREEIAVLMDEYNVLQESREAFFDDMGAEQGEELFVGGNVREIFEPFKPENLIRIFPESLNHNLGGGVPPGTYIVVFGRPEIGKSLISINLTAGFLKQYKRVLYICNEDAQHMLRSRVVCRLSELSREEVLEDYDYAQDLAYERGFGGLHFLTLWPGTVARIAQQVAKLEPDVLIVDQLRNLRTAKTLNKVENLEEVSQGLRNIVKKHNIVGVGITQAGDSAEGKNVLTQGDIDFSNTGIPGTADVMIGIGADERTLELGQRVLSMPKNKLNGNHSSFPVRVIPHISKVVSI